MFLSTINEIAHKICSLLLKDITSVH